jgi:hypothetical protein
MRLTPRLGFRLILVVFAVVVICVRLIPRHRVGPAGSRVFSDLAATSPLNQPGGDPALAEAYEVYSALYQAPSQTPTQEPLVFADNSVTDIPQVGGSCLKPTTPDEREMTDAFVAANQQSHRWEQKFTIPQGIPAIGLQRSRPGAELYRHARPGFRRMRRLPTGSAHSFPRSSWF